MTDILNDVSRETVDKLKHYEQLVRKWNKKINLVGKSDAGSLWERHILDSVQVATCTATSGHWLDLGSGGGFPGVVAAIMRSGDDDVDPVVMVESDQRKSAFLRTAIRELGLNASVKAIRIEELPSQASDVVSARALADLDTLLGYAFTHLAPDGIALFPKGESWRSEHEKAQQRWRYSLDAVQSLTNSNAAILKIRNIERV